MCFDLRRGGEESCCIGAGGAGCDCDSKLKDSAIGLNLRARHSDCISECDKCSSDCGSECDIRSSGGGADCAAKATSVGVTIVIGAGSFEMPKAWFGV